MHLVGVSPSKEYEWPCSVSCSSSSGAWIINLLVDLWRMHQLICFFLFKTEVSSRASRSMATKTSKRRSKTSMEGTANFIICVPKSVESHFFALITVSLGKHSCGLKADLPLGEGGGGMSKDWESDEDMWLLYTYMSS